MSAPLVHHCTATDPSTREQCTNTTELYLCQDHALELEELIQEAGFLWACLDPVMQATKSTRPANQGPGSSGAKQWTPPVPDAAVGLDRDGIRAWPRTHTTYRAWTSSRTMRTPTTSSTTPATSSAAPGLLSTAPKPQSPGANQPGLHPCPPPTSRMPTHALGRPAPLVRQTRHPHQRQVDQELGPVRPLSPAPEQPTRQQNAPHLPSHGDLCRPPSPSPRPTHLQTHAPLTNWSGLKLRKWRTQDRLDTERCRAFFVRQRRGESPARVEW